MNPLETMLKVMHEHMTADSNDIYVEMLKLTQHCIDELDGYDYETNSDGEILIKALNEAVEDFESSQREEEIEADVEVDDDEERDLSDIDEDNETVFNQNQKTGENIGT